ncbi:AAA-like domain-containing protein [Nostoc paludosum FACHB-159]|uniref:AAA-like domain-containing protein n=1 Tax=Nostoc paludosum FACHB-159 TaxID=2692908 RepID=A0ABR8KCD9_9NOSO|nr:AAA-like domain-containing protein [Nostoc sp. FACHB-857]MBD2736511.1 AAA-like domain-containing protein [Nostoc paludosum FACHB-159]
MTVEELLDAVERILQNRPLDSIQWFVLYQSWLGKTYDEMAEGTGYGSNYIKQIGSQLWQDLSEATGERITKKNLHLVLSKYLQGISKQQNQPQEQQFNKKFRFTRLDPNFFSGGKMEFPSGPLPAGSTLYINRPPLEQLICSELIQPGCLIRIKAPKKTGKSSLLNQMIAYAKEQDYQIIYLDFQEADEEVFTSLDKFLRWFCIYVTRQLNLFPCLDDFWDTDMGSKVSCKIYFEGYLLQYIASNPVILALNEVQRVFEHPNIAQDFLPMLRFWHEQAKQDQTWQKLRIVVVHTTEIYVPLKLNQSPFNVGITITLPPFTLNQVQDLALRYGLEWAADSQGIKRLESLQAMVGGHPYLVSLALYHLSGEKMTLEMLLETASTPMGIYTQHLRELLNLLQKEPELMSAMQQVMASNEKVELDAIAAYKLESMGLVQLNGNQACIMCELYRLYFSQQLVKL